MTWLHLVLVALVQGITEFLPISSSAHLILAPRVTGVPDQGPMIDLATHVGTLFAVLLAFRRDVAEAATGLGHLAKGRRTTWEARLAGYLMIATVPVVALGAIFHAFDVMEAIRQPGTAMLVIGWTTLLYGVLLWVADRYAPTTRPMEDVRLRDAVMVGMVQALALVPGTSRSGVTMTGARLLGFDRPSAARFSMLLAIPTILAAGTLGAKDLIESGDAALGLDAAIAAGLSFVAALVAIKLFMRWIARATMTPFVIYRLVLGGVLLSLAYT